jgi:hypothetical protein
MATYKADVVIYGQTLAAILCAAAVADAGKKPLLVNPVKHWGGVAASGLLNWDYGPGDIRYRGSYLEALLYKLMLGRTGDDNYAYRFLARDIAWGGQTLGQYYGVRVLPNHKYVSCVGGKLDAPGSAITSVTFRDSGGNDHTVVPYGSDMICIAGTYDSDWGREVATYVIGREPQSLYNEPHAGFGHNMLASTVPTTFYPDNITYLPGYRAYPIGAVEGEGDGDFADPGGGNITNPAIQPCGVRIPLSRYKDGFCRRFFEPSGYDYNKIAFIYPYPEAAIFNITTPASQGVFEYNGDTSNDLTMRYLNGAPAPIDRWAVRGEGPDGANPGTVWQDAIDQMIGRFWFLQTDQRVPAFMRKRTSQWGFVSDEFPNNSSLPYEIYVRSGYRLKSTFVITENYCSPTGSDEADVVARASYGMDIHTEARWVTTPGIFYTDNGFNNDPLGTLARKTRNYGIPWRALKADPADCTNWIDILHYSQTAKAEGSGRMEPAFLYNGVAAGYIAARCLQLGETLATIDIPTMQTELAAKGHFCFAP